MVVVAGRKPHVLNILGVSTGTLPVSVCLLPVPVSTLSCTPFHRSPTINSQRFALFDSTFSVRFKLISHSLPSDIKTLPLHSLSATEDVPTCQCLGVCVCRRLPPRSVTVFGLWRVRFPPVLVRTGRRLPVQALGERRVLVAVTGYPRGGAPGPGRIHPWGLL